MNEPFETTSRSAPMGASSSTPSAAATYDPAAIVKIFIDRYDLSAEDVLKALAVDEHGRRHVMRVDLGQISVDTANAGAGEQIAHLKSHIDFATRKEASGRWLHGIRRRSARLKQTYADLFQVTLDEQLRDLGSRPTHFFAELLRHLDAELTLLKRKQAETQAIAGRVAEQLRPLQQEIEEAINPKSNGPIWTRVLDIVTSLVQTVGKSVGLVGKVMTAERLVNDREEYACTLDLIAASMGLLQELRGRAQTELDQLRQLQQKVQGVMDELGRQRTSAQARLAKHPYAQVDVTNLRQAELIAMRVTVELPMLALARYQEMSNEQLHDTIFAQALTQTRRHTAALGLTDIMEMEAATLAERSDAAANSDLVIATIQMAYERTGTDTLQLKPNASPRDWWLVGVPDETNPAFNFGGASLVSTKRRDQFLFLRVRTGLALTDLAGVEMMSSAFDQAAKRRNYFVLDAMVADDRARRTFALGLATGIVHIHGGGFAIEDSRGLHQLGSTVETALAQFEAQEVLHRVIEGQMNRIPLVDLCATLEGYLARGQASNQESDAQTALWREIAEHIEDHLTVLYEQMRFVAGLNGTNDAPTSMLTKGDAA